MLWRFCSRRAIKLDLHAGHGACKKTPSQKSSSKGHAGNHSAGKHTLSDPNRSDFESQIASDCNRNSKNSLRLQERPLQPTVWTRDPPVLCGFYSVSEAPHSCGTLQNPLRLQACDSESLRFFWPNALFVIVILRFYCDFCGKSLRLRSCDCQSLAICDCDCLGH